MFYRKYIFSKSILELKMFNWWLMQYNICWHQLVKTAEVGGDLLFVSGLRSVFFLCLKNYCAQFSISSHLVVMPWQIKSVNRSAFLKHAYNCSAFELGCTKNSPWSHAKQWGDLPAQRIYWVRLFTLLSWEKEQEVDMNVVSEGQVCHQLALLIVLFVDVRVKIQYCPFMLWNTQ